MGLLGGRYRLVEPVGQGGMAVVWRAEDELLHRTVAVKLLAPQLASDHRSRELIRAEAYAAARLNHPHIANVYDYGETRVGGYRRTPYLVMEFVRGETLAARLRADGALDWPQAVRVCADVAAALAAAHAEGLVHRDVKPANVLLSPRGVKVVDLGIALSVGQQAISEQGEVLGTPRYMAPEQVSGDAAVPASDVYALGLLLHECLTGRPLRRGGTVTELFAADHLADVLSEVDVPGLPEPVDLLRRRCLAPAPEERSSSAEAAALLAEVAGIRPPTLVGAAVPRAGAPEAALTTRLSPPSGLSPRGLSLLARRPMSGRRRVARQGLLLAAVPVTALTAVLAAQLPGLTSTNDAAEGAASQTGSPAPGCTARYDAHRSPDGTFTAQLTVTGAGPQTAGPWLVSFAVPAGQQLVAEGGAVRLEQRAGAVTVDVARQAPAGTATIGLRGRYDGAAAGEPTDFALNGAPCGRASTSVVSTTTDSQPAAGGAMVPGDGGRPADPAGRTGSRGGGAAADDRGTGGGRAPRPTRAPSGGATPTAGTSPSGDATSAPPAPSGTPNDPAPTATQEPTGTPGPAETTEPGPAPTESTGGVPGAEPTPAS